MLSIDVTETTNDGEITQYIFRTNNDGCYLFIGDENRQISHDSGYNSLRRIKTAIRTFLRRCHYPDLDGAYPKLKFKTNSEFNRP